MTTLNHKLRSANIRLRPGHMHFGPEWLILGVNNICNLHCKMCDVGADFNESNFFQNLVGTHPLNMPMDLFRTVADQAAQHFPKTKLGYAFTEPLIYKHLIETLEYAQERSLFTAVTTNGLTLARHANALVDAGLNELYISLDGPEEIHNAIRGHRNSYGRAMEGVECLLTKNGAPEISIYCVITEWNIGHLRRFLDGLKQYPLVRVGFMHTVFTPQDQADRHNAVYGQTYPATASNMEEIDLSAMDLDLLWEEIETIRKTAYGFPIVFSPEMDTRADLDRFYYEPDTLWGKRCNDAFRAMMIKSDGSVIPAHGRCYNLSVGNLHDNSLPEIWNSDVFGKFRRDLMHAGGLMPACARCCSAF